MRRIQIKHIQIKVNWWTTEIPFSLLNLAMALLMHFLGNACKFERKCGKREKELRNVIRRSIRG